MRMPYSDGYVDKFIDISLMKSNVNIVNIGLSRYRNCCKIAKVT